MGKSKLVWSPIELQLENKYKVYSIGQLEQVQVNIEGVKINLDFEIIEIMDISDPYTALHGIDWAFDNKVVLNLNKRQISFEIDTVCMVAPVDHYEGDRYNDTMDEYGWRSTIENIYNIIGYRDDYINPTIDGELSWRTIKSYNMDSEGAMERWLYV
jgi:hypothetical protein